MSYLHYRQWTISSRTSGSSSNTPIAATQGYLQPILGKSRSGKTSVLQALFEFDYRNRPSKPDSHCPDQRPFPIQSVDAMIEIPWPTLKKTLAMPYNDPRQHKLRLLLTIACDAIAPGRKRYRLKHVNRISKHTKPPQELLDSIKTRLGRLSSTEHENIARQIINQLPRIALFDIPNIGPPPQYIELKPSRPHAGPHLDWTTMFTTIMAETASKSEPALSKNNVHNAENIINRMLEKASSNWLDQSRWPYRLQIEKQNKQIRLWFHHRNEGVISAQNLPKPVRWAFTFLMLRQFGYGLTADAPLVALFDEPGSFLPASDQYRLLAKLHDFGKHNPVIYTSQSHQMFNLEQVQLKRILLLTRGEQNQVQLELIKKSSTAKSRHDSLMLQPIFNTLNLDSLDYFFAINRPVLLVEGMADRFYLDLFLPETTRARFFIVASQGASSLVRNIQYLVAMNKKFIVLADRDPAGEKGIRQCRTHFKSYPWGRYLVLPNISSRHPDKTVIEDMLSPETQLTITKYLRLSPTVYPKSLIFTLTREGPKALAHIRKTQSAETQKHFADLAHQLERTFFDLMQSDPLAAIGHEREC